MAHIVFCDNKAKELEKIVSGEKTMLIRGAEGRKIPHSRVFNEDELFFIEKGSNKITHKAVVTDVQNYVKLSEQEINDILSENEGKLCLTDKQKVRFHKRCLCLVEFDKLEQIEPVDFEPRSSLDDWLIVDSLED